MRLLYFIPIVLAVIIFFTIRFINGKNQSENFKITMQIIALIFCILSMVFVFKSYSYSGDKTQLYKLSLPLIIGILAFVQIIRSKKKG